MLHGVSLVHLTHKRHDQSAASLASSAARWMQAAIPLSCQRPAFLMVCAYWTLLLLMIRVCVPSLELQHCFRALIDQEDVFLCSAMHAATRQQRYWLALLRLICCGVPLCQG